MTHPYPEELYPELKEKKNQEIQLILQHVYAECERARAKHGPFHSTHEAYGVILEELDEWWDSVKADTPDDKELLSVAAMAILAIVELKGQCVKD